MQNELHVFEMNHQELEMKAKERERLQQTVAELKGEVSSSLNRVKASERHTSYLEAASYNPGATGTRQSDAKHGRAFDSLEP